jgi:putative ABC transport system permease protein
MGGETGGPLWSFLPVSEYRKVPGVSAAVRVGRFSAGIELSGALVSGQFFGIDRADFGRAAFWRPDFAPSSLGSLMNALALVPEGVLLPRSVMAQHGLQVGDWISAVVITGGRRNRLRLQIVGEFDLFPGWYPEQGGPLLVGNLEHLFEQAGNLYPYDVWLRVDEQTEPAQVMENLRSFNPRLGDAVLAWGELQTELERPERQGLFGVLSIGFIAAALLAVLGFLLYALFSFRQRFIELGILRAIGLSVGNMTTLLAFELAFLILLASGVGSLLGIWASKLFIPYLQVGTGPDARVPPYFVLIAWPAIIRMWELLAILFGLALAALAALLVRLRIFQAVRLGEMT